MIGQDKKYQPHPNFARSIINGRTTFSGIEGIDEHQIKLANNEFGYVIDLFESKEPFTFKNLSFETVLSRINLLRDHIITNEDRMRPILKKIALKTISDIYGINEGDINWDIEFSLEGMIDYDMDDSPLNIKRSRIPYLQEQVKKRKILNALVHGSSMHIWKTVHYTVKEQLDELSPILFPLYDSYVALVGSIIWLYDPLSVAREIQQGLQMSQGVNAIEFKDDGEINVKVKAINFPTMLHEINKGVIDLIVCHGLPDDVTEDELKYIYREADKYEEEVWHYTISPAIWEKLITQLSLPTQSLPDVIMRLSKLSLAKLQTIMDLISTDDPYLKTELEKNKIL